MIFLAAMVILPFVLHADPSASMFRSKDQARRYECESTSAEQGDTLRPGQVVTSPPRGDYVERDAVICVERLMRPGLRAPRDEAILSSLDSITSELASNAVGIKAEDADGRSLVPAAQGDATALALLEGRAQAFGRPLYGDERWGSLSIDLKWTCSAGKEAVYVLAAEPGETNDLRASADLTPLRAAMGQAIDRSSPNIRAPLSGPTRSL